MTIRRMSWIRLSRPSRGRLIAGFAVLVVLAGAGTFNAVTGESSADVRRADQVMEMPGARIDTSYFTAGDSKAKRPAVLIGHGFGGSKSDTREQAEKLARDGYAVLTWSARGFGESGGEIGLNDPEREGADVSRMIDWLAERPEVELDGDGDPRVGVTGASYGGAASLLAAGHDERVDAIAPQVTYWSLADSLFPDGVFKKLWAGIFFTTGSAEIGGPPQRTAAGACGRFEAELCEMYERVASSGKPDEAARELLEQRSPSAVGEKIKVPALIVQGQTDSLFPLGQADAMAEQLRKNGAPVAVDWIAGGHDGGELETDRVQARISSWFDRYLKEDKGADTGPAFRVTRTGGVDSTDGAAQLRGASADEYPGLAQGERSIALRGREQSFSNPPGGAPSAISSVPGVGALSQLSSLGLGLNIDFPGQFARFESEPLDVNRRITGSPTIDVEVKAGSGDAVLFGKVYDVGPDGQEQVLPSQLVAPVRVEDAAGGRTVKLTLPAIDHQVDAGHSLRLVLAATDLGYASPNEQATYTVGLKGELTLPSAPEVDTAAAPLPAWAWIMPLVGAFIAAGLLISARRKVSAPAADAALADVPLDITGLSKRYAKSADLYAVRDLSFRVEKGQVLGLLGPNGAGKTTTLRMLMGLISPDEGEIRVFGHAIRPGAPVLSRVGSFVEGAGFLPHLTGRANLELYWAATGRPREDAYLEEALEIAGLEDEALKRAVRTYSQGMRQRLAIAQAMLGLPELLILDEPLNGLDPPQIREMREVMIRYAAEGRTVIVSSHLMSEVEQTCTHLVVMDHGRLVQAGPVAEITGGGDTLLVGTAGGFGDELLGKVAALPGVGSAERAEGGLLVRLDGASVSELIAGLVALEIPLTGVGPHRRLEDAFLTLIGAPA